MLEFTWSEFRVAAELLRLADEADGKHLPPHRVIRAESRTLLRSMQQSGGTKVWTRRLGLAKWPPGRPWPTG